MAGYDMKYDRIMDYVNQELELFTSDYQPR